MRIQQKTLSAGPDGVFQPGSIREVDEATGRYMIAQGIAVRVKSAAPAAAPEVAVREAATAEPEAEQAADTDRPNRRRRRRGEALNGEPDGNE